LGCLCALQVIARNIDANATTLEIIGATAFTGCESLVNVGLHKGRGKIGYDAFLGCKITDPCVHTFHGENTADYKVFAYCQSFVQVEMQEGIKCIAAFAFQDCVSLCSISISVYDRRNPSPRLCWMPESTWSRVFKEFISAHITLVMLQWMSSTCQHIPSLRHQKC
jgi:hypothetical protein